jgi:hypothetical protein
MKQSTFYHLTFCITYPNQKQEREKSDNLQAQNVSVNSLHHKSGTSHTTIPHSSKFPLGELKNPTFGNF